MHHEYKYFSSLFIPTSGKRLMQNTTALLLFFFVLVTPFFSGQTVGAAIDISDDPLDGQISAAAPNFMIGFDDSGSMDWEVLTSESNGLFGIGGTSYYYVFDDPGDNRYSGNIITGENRLYWKSQFAGHNVMYYNPDIDYEPWQYGDQPPVKDFADADFNRPRSHPYYTDFPTVRANPNLATTPTGDYLDLNNTYASVGGIIVDNLDGSPAFVTTGTWQESGSTPEHDGSSVYAYQAAGIGNTATFTPNIPTAGNYDVDAWWNCWNERDEQAQITINHSAGSDVLTRNQRSTTGTCGTWVSLGSYNFNAGTLGSVTIARAGDSGVFGNSTVADAVRFVGAGAVDIKNAHYYTWYDANGDTNIDIGEVYLVNLDGDITYYQLNGDGDDKVEAGELTMTLTPPAPVQTGRTYAQERQNFANWYSFYRKRRLTAISAISRIIPRLRGVNVGIRSINAHIVQPVLPVAVSGVNQKDTLLDAFFSYHQRAQSAASTPLRRGMESIGRYYHVNQTQADLGTSPLVIGPTGECQMNFTLMFTDGAYNGGDPSVGNADSGKGVPYEDTVSNSLADVAMYYWGNDLSPAIDNKVPQNAYDTAIWQHMVTYTVAFGLEGNLNISQYTIPNCPCPVWSTNIDTDAEKTDDLWHAAINGRGKYLSAKTPQALSDALDDIINDVHIRIGSGASVSINGEKLYAGSVMYQSGYSVDGWTGDVIAYDLHPISGSPILNPYKWSASKVMDKADADARAVGTNYWDTGRIIASYDGSDGIPFRYPDLSPAQQAIIVDSDMLEYLRGNHDLELKNISTNPSVKYRDRVLNNGIVTRSDTLLLDIVHSSPLYNNNIIYVGGNDGMLHAFNAQNGAEIFAYVPNLVFDNLPDLTDPAYTHKYYVDLTPVVKTTNIKPLSMLNGLPMATGNADLLVGGLGKGGKGYYCIDVTDPLSITDEDELANKVRWEYPNSATPQSDIDDIGYSFSRAALIHTKAGWVVIFGNGYNSTNENAVLFILEAETGTLLKKIDVGKGPVTGFPPSVTLENGLSTPSAIDVNADFLVDYVYVGDLLGNMWKFDLTDPNYSAWDVAYGGSPNPPEPLFQARDALSNPQPITTKPEVMFHCEKFGYMVTFGTGRYLGTTDLTDSSLQTIYGIWDYGDDSDPDEYIGYFDRGSATNKLSNQPNTVTLLEQVVAYQNFVTGVGKTLRVLSNNPPDWSTDVDATVGEKPNPSQNAGWYFDLPDTKERVVRDIIIRGGTVIAISSVPQSGTACTAGGRSWLMEMDACTGGRLSHPKIDINDDTKIDNPNDTIDIQVPDPTNPANMITINVAPTGIASSNMLYAPAIIDIPGDTEKKIFGTSAGGTQVIDEQDPGQGKYWREVTN